MNVEYVMPQRTTFAVLLVLVGLSCSRPPAAPSNDAALKAVTALLTERAAQTDSRPLRSQKWCPGYKYEVRVNSVQIGEFSVSTQSWPVRANIDVGCNSFSSRELNHELTTEDYSLTPDGFGGWKANL